MKEKHHQIGIEILHSADNEFFLFHYPKILCKN